MRDGSITRRRRKLRGILLVAIASLYVLSIPWYRGADDGLRIWFGLPDWVAVSIGCYFVIAILNALAWLLVEVPESEPDSREKSR